MIDLPQLISLGTALPSNRYEQMSLYEDILAPYYRNNRHAETIFRKTGVGYRHLAVDPAYFETERTTQVRNERYLDIAKELGEAAIRRCLKAAGLAPEAVDDLIVVSCTGIDTPGLDLILAGALGMRSDLQRSSILGMGCYAAMPGLLRAWQSAMARPGKKALLLSVEVCSLHFQPDDDSTEAIVSAGLFGDGAAAALVSSELPTQAASAQASGPRLIDFATQCDYQTLDQMAFHLTDHGFRMRLSAYVPAVLAANIEGFVDRLLERNSLRRSNIPIWAVHPGSQKILSYTQERLGLPAGSLDCSYAVLYDYGNMSSPTILFILDRLQRESLAHPGDYGVLLAFGPGLTIEGALVQW